MAITIEWRREPDRQHTGSFELRGVSGTPFLYVHPQDQADNPRGSCAGWWWYNHRDTTESPVTANKFDIYVNGRVSYAAYHQTRQLYRSLGGWTKFAIGIVTNSYRLQENPSEVFNAPVASSLQVSGVCIYKGYLKFDPPPTKDLKLDIDAALCAYAEGETTRGAAIGMGRSILSYAKVFDHKGNEMEKVRAKAKLQFPKDKADKRKNKLYSIEVTAGTKEIHIGTVNTGPSYTIGSGKSVFNAWAEIAFTVTGENNTIILEPPSETAIEEEEK